MKTLELKLPPPLVAALCGLAMWLVAQDGGMPAHGTRALAAALALAGLAVDLSAYLAFRRRDTTINPLRPETTRALVTHGIYRHTRNPMYVGLFLLLAAWAVWLVDGTAALFLPVFVAYMTRFQILPEEHILTDKFGADYAAYRRRVRRWI